MKPTEENKFSSVNINKELCVYIVVLAPKGGKKKRRKKDIRHTSHTPHMAVLTYQGLYLSAAKTPKPAKHPAPMPARIPARWGRGKYAGSEKEEGT